MVLIHDRLHIGTIGVAVVLVVAGIANAQTCQGRVIADLGYQSVSCTGCLVEYVNHEVPQPGFMAEPIVHQVRAGGPAAGKLAEGDTIVSVDGIDIGTREAAIRMATAGAAIQLTVRQNGGTSRVVITPGSNCLPGPKGFDVRIVNMLPRTTAAGSDTGLINSTYPSTLSFPVGVNGISILANDDTITWRVGGVARGATVAPGTEGGWLGIGLTGDSALSAFGTRVEFRPTGWLRLDALQNPARVDSSRRVGYAVMWFSAAPVIQRIDPASPAARAGLEPGLVLYSVDGLSLRSDVGAAWLASVRPGDQVRLTVGGPNGLFEKTLTAERRPPPPPAVSCDAKGVDERFAAFVAAMNRGDADLVGTFFPPKNSALFRRFVAEGFAGSSTDDLTGYFARRHRQHETLTQTVFVVDGRATPIPVDSYDAATDVLNFGPLYLRVSADDLGSGTRQMIVKGAMHCGTGTFTALFMGVQ